MLDLFTLLVFLVVFVGVYAVRASNRRLQRAEAVAARLEALRKELRRVADAQEIAQASSTSAALATRSDPSSAQTKSGRLTKLRDGLRAIGWMPTIRKRILLSLAVTLLAAVGLVGMSDVSGVWTLVFWPVIWALSAYQLYRRAMDKHLAALSRSLPETIDAITRIVRSGVPLHSAFAIAADHLSGPLAIELREIDHWLKLGVPIKQAMQSSATRVPLPEYRFFAVILIISQESGGRLGDTLERLSATLRSRAELGMKVQARTSEARASAKIVAMLVPGVLLYMYVNAPGDFRFMFNDSTGIQVMLYAAASVSLGLFITHLMVKRVR